MTGKVVGADGKPIKGANVLVYLNQHGERKTLDLLTDAAGGFAVEADLTLLQQDNALGGGVAYAPGYALTTAQLKKSGNVITLNPGTTISGTVVDAEGKPLAGVPVCLRYCRDGDNTTLGVPEEWHARFTVHSAADGSWTLPGIPLVGRPTVCSQ